jgi:addiction module RelE/StbE family toxin
VTRIVWTSQAIEDVEAIRAYIARDSAWYGARLTEQILEAIERAAEFPLAGRVVPEMGRTSIREIILGNYRIVYRVGADIMEIATVFHASRSFPSVAEQGGL